MAVDQTKFNSGTGDNDVVGVYTTATNKVQYAHIYL